MMEKILATKNSPASVALFLEDQYQTLRPFQGTFEAPRVQGLYVRHLWAPTVVWLQLGNQSHSLEDLKKKKIYKLLSSDNEFKINLLPKTACDSAILQGS